MHRTTALAAVLATAILVPAGSAAAKELTTLSVCGAHGCVSRTDQLAAAKRGHDGLLDLGTPMADPGAAPFVKLRLGIGDGNGTVFGRDVMVFLPRSGLVRAGDGVWYQLPADSLAFFRRASRGVPRLPASRLPAFHAPPPAPVAQSDPLPPAVTPARHAIAPPSGGGGASAALIGGFAALALAAAAGGTLAWRRHRPGPDGRPAAG